MRFLRSLYYILHTHMDFSSWLRFFIGRRELRTGLRDFVRYDPPSIVSFSRFQVYEN